MEAVTKTAPRSATPSRDEIMSMIDTKPCCSRPGSYFVFHMEIRQGQIDAFMGNEPASVMIWEIAKSHQLDLSYMYTTDLAGKRSLEIILEDGAEVVGRKSREAKDKTNLADAAERVVRLLDVMIDYEEMHRQLLLRSSSELVRTCQLGY